MTSYNQSKVSPRKEGKRAYSQNMVCNHENTLTSKGGFKVVPFIHEKPKLPLLLPSSITFIKTLKIFIFLSSLFEVLIMPRTGSIFSGSDPSFVHRKDSEWRIEERGGTWQKYLRSIVPTTILVDYIIFLHCILLSNYLLARLIIIRLQYMGFRTIKEKLIT